MKGSNAKPFRILSLDGGGIRGAFIAAFLAGIEGRLRCHIADYFDLIAGTSTGGIVAAALALHEPAAKVEAFYRECGPKVFTRRAPIELGFWDRCKASLVRMFGKHHGYNVDYDNMLQSKYQAEELRQALTGVFGDQKVGDARTRLLIPAVDMIRGQTIVFKTPHFPKLFRDRHYRIVDVLMATTAAPTYFPHAMIEPGSAYADGGLWINNPSIGAIVEALKIQQCADREGFDFPIDQESIYLLSVGTGKAKFFGTPPEGGAGILWWAPHLLNVPFVAQSQGINFQAKYLLGDRAHRIDYELPNERWTLDNVEVLDQMIQIGHERCNETLGELQGVFFDSKAQHPFQAFPDMGPADSAITTPPADHAANMTRRRAP